jgi:hypothetical protein
MGRGVLLLALALALATFASLAPPQASVNNANADRRAYAHVNGGSRQIAFVSEAQSLERSRHKEPCQDTHDDRQSDVCAQWKSADWTEIGTIVAIIGIAALLYQIWLTVQAVEDTGKATDAMLEGNKISRETMERQLRAYVEFDNVGWLLEEKQKEPDRMRTGVRIQLRNYGHTPASEIVCEMNLLIRGEGKEIPLLEDGPVKEDWGSVAPTDHLTKRSLFDVPLSVWDLIGTEKVKLISQLRVRYLDAFEKPHTLDSDFESTAHDQLFSFVMNTRKAD